MKINSRKLCILVCCALLAACAAPTRIASNKAANYTTEPKRIFVLTNIGSEYGKEFSDAFQHKLIAIAKDCGAVLEVSKITSLELDENIHLVKMKTFNADTLLDIRRNGGTKTQYGQLIHVIYDARMIDVQSNKTVWRADTNFYRGSTTIPIAERGETLAVDITNKMKQDKIFRSCEIIVQKK